MADLTIKVRVRVLRPMPAHTARALVWRALWDGIVPPGIEIGVIEWRKGGRDYRYGAGQRMPPDVLRKLDGILQAGARQRWEVVRRDVEGQG